MLKNLLVPTILFAAIPAHAAATLYTTEAAYLAAVGATTTYVDFIGTPGVSVAGGSFTAAVTFGTCVAGVCGSTVFHNSNAITDNGGGGPPAGVAAVGGAFTAPVRAFGFNYISGGMGSIDLNAGATLVAVNSGVSGFVGIVSDTDINSFIGVNNTFLDGSTDRYFIDDFRINNPVPEASTWALFGVGLFAVGALSRRRAKGQVSAR